VKRAVSEKTLSNFYIKREESAALCNAHLFSLHRTVKNPLRRLSFGESIC